MHIICAKEWVLSKIEKVETERESASEFSILSLFFYFLLVFNEIYDNKKIKSLCAILLDIFVYILKTTEKVLKL